jgi:inner membrane transporter RhtA
VIASRGESPRFAALAPFLAVVIAMLSFASGGAIAKTLVATVGPAGATALRMAFGTMLLLIFWRPWRVWRDVFRRAGAQTLRDIAIYGASMGCMNLLFYASLNRLPLGIAVAVEFTGPLALAMLSSRRALDFLWIGLATAGLLVLLPVGSRTDALDPVGIAFALGAGACWAAYIVFGKRAGAGFGGEITALGMLVGAAIVVPIGIATAGSRLSVPSIWPAALGVALLSSALPYSLEMFALTRLPTRTFGILMSMEPALGALAAFCFLGERLTALQWVAVVGIILASAGSAASAPRSPQVARGPDPA